MNVLVVDENELVADSLAFMLDCYGHRAVVASDGETALKLRRTGAFELAFLDENLPGIKGSAVALSLKDTPVYPEPFVVSMTGDADSREDVARFFDVCLEKPFCSEALIQVIEDARSSDASSLLAA
jgi:CheY-like chemotaxis protein